MGIGVQEDQVRQAANLIPADSIDHKPLMMHEFYDHLSPRFASRADVTVLKLGSVPLSVVTARVALRPQMLREPIRRGLRRAVELVGVSREVTTGVELQPLGFAGAVERRQAEVGGADGVCIADHHE